jgi:hypothetical protein
MQSNHNASFVALCECGEKIDGIRLLFLNPLEKRVTVGGSKLMVNRSSKKFALAMLSVLFVSLLFSSLTVTPCKAADYTKVGVKVGDWAHYSYSTNITQYSSYTYINITIMNIERDNITFRLTLYNATPTATQNTVTWGNISSGENEEESPPTWESLLAANLTKGDPLYDGSALWINDTGTMIAGGNIRTCNHFTGILSTTADNYYWDQSTGIIVKWNNTVTVSGGHEYSRAILVSTSLWSPASAPTIDHPAALIYTSGTTGHNITWNPLSLVPSNYTITRNGTQVASGSWNGHAITYSVDGLAVGAYVFNCTVCDMIGHRASSVVTVTVNAKASSSPGLSVVLLIAIVGGVAVVIVLIAVIALRKRTR